MGRVDEEVVDWEWDDWVVHARTRILAEDWDGLSGDLGLCAAWYPLLLLLLQATVSAAVVLSLIQQGHGIVQRFETDVH